MRNFDFNFFSLKTTVLFLLEVCSTKIHFWSIKNIQKYNRKQLPPQLTQPIPLLSQLLAADSFTAFCASESDPKRLFL